MPLKITSSHRAVYVPSSDAAPDSSDLSELSEDDHLGYDDSEDDTLFEHDGCETGSEIASRQVSIHHYNVKEWDTRDAYRELYKFWKQTIVRSFAVDDTFHHQYEETRNWITVKALIPTWPGYMGFIRYSKATGTIIFVNADALLLQSTHIPSNNSSAPGTEDPTNDTLFQFQNERLKAVAYVLLRSGFNIQITSRKYIWTFNLPPSILKSSPNNSNLLSCTVSDLNLTHKPITTITPTWQPRPTQDLTITITTSHPQLLLLTPRIFRTWLRVSLHLTESPSANIIRTQHGDILLDPEYSGMLYLRGILLPESGFDKRQYKYGYNFHYGIPTTSGRRLASPLHELDLICSIWDAAICSNPGEVLPKFVEMIYGGRPWPVDVIWADGGGGGGGGGLMAAEAVKAVWWSLLVRGGDGMFYYCGPRGEEASEIRRLLGKEPVAIPSGFWDALRTLRLIRTVWEERDVRAVR
ncbi:hypothetical protein AbraIFM66950_011714 [Aspergillus brasiliensis]|nr:hypothetical protein AbraIFM66950_011714 [Aspergillus brasiliensis]